LNEFAPPRQLKRWVASPFSLTNFKHAPRIEACVVDASGRKSGCVVSINGPPNNSLQVIRG